MNYKVCIQEPHITLVEIKKAFDEEKPYKAQSICLSYFSHLENHNHVKQAIDYHTKDDVYNYIKKHMNNGNANVDKANEYIEKYKEKLEEIREQSKEYEQTMLVLEKICVDNKIDLHLLVEQHFKKSQKELVEANKSVTERQNGKVATSKEVAPMPMGEEYEKLMQADAEYKIGLFPSIHKKP